MDLAKDMMMALGRFRIGKLICKNFIDETRRRRFDSFDWRARDEFEDAVGALEEWKADALFEEPLPHDSCKNCLSNDRHNVSGVIDFGLFRREYPSFLILHISGFARQTNCMETVHGGIRKRRNAKREIKAQPSVSKTCTNNKTNRPIGASLSSSKICGGNPHLGRTLARESKGDALSPEFQRLPLSLLLLPLLL